MTDLENDPDNDPDNDDNDNDNNDDDHNNNYDYGNGRNKTNFEKIQIPRNPKMCRFFQKNRQISRFSRFSKVPEIQQWCSCQPGLSEPRF